MRMWQLIGLVVLGWQLPEGLFPYWHGEVTSYEPWPPSGG